MKLSDFFPMWDTLSNDEKQILQTSAQSKYAKKGTALAMGQNECTGLILVQSGQLRAYIISDEGKEMTLYRLIDQDICLFSAACMYHSLQFDIHLDVEKDTEYFLIPTDIYRSIMESSVTLSNFTNEMMANRFSEVMWLMEQVMWKSLDTRLAAFLLEESSLEQSNVLHLTHERIGQHIGSAREVITRMLRYFQSEHWIQLSRGTITLLDTKKLTKISTS